MKLYKTILSHSRWHCSLLVCGVEICQKNCQCSCNPLHHRNCEYYYCKDDNLQNTNTEDDDRGCSKWCLQTLFSIRNFLTEATKRVVLYQVGKWDIANFLHQKTNKGKSCKRREPCKLLDITKVSELPLLGVKPLWN